MSKKSKITLTVLIIVVVLGALPVLSYISKHIINNCIADNIETELLDIDLPESTKLIDSVSNAGKIVGNGNGMQYVGALLVTSDLTTEELKIYYSEKLDHIDVYNVHSEMEFNTHYRVYDFPADIPENTYCIECWDDKTDEKSRVFVAWLNGDLRGH